MDKTSIYKLAPYVLKRMEYGINKFYLLNFSNNEIWVGNYASYLIISKMDGETSIDKIISEIKDFMTEYSYDDIFKSVESVVTELLEKSFLIIK